MKTSCFPCCWSLRAALILLCGLAAFAVVSCDDQAPLKAPAKSPPKTAAEAAPAIKRTQIGKDLFFEIDGNDRRVIAQAVVVLRRANSKGCSAVRIPRNTNTSSPLRPTPARFTPLLSRRGASQDRPFNFNRHLSRRTAPLLRSFFNIRRTAKPSRFLRRNGCANVKTKKNLEINWVFAGSRLMPNPEDAKKPPFYLANEGDVICVCNMDTAMLDLPVASPTALADRVFEANTERIPPLGTKVDVIFEVIHDKKDKEKDK